LNADDTDLAEVRGFSTALIWGCDTEIHKEGAEGHGGSGLECWGDGVLGCRGGSCLVFLVLGEENPVCLGW